MNQLLLVAAAILTEAGLSFLGLGVQPPLPSWGLMIAEGRQHLLFEPWVIVIPGVALFLLVRAVFVSLTHIAPSPIDAITGRSG